MFSSLGRIVRAGPSGLALTRGFAATAVEPTHSHPGKDGKKTRPPHVVQTLGEVDTHIPSLRLHRQGDEIRTHSWEAQVRPALEHLKRLGFTPADLDRLARESPRGLSLGRTDQAMTVEGLEQWLQGRLGQQASGKVKEFAMANPQVFKLSREEAEVRLRQFSQLMGMSVDRGDAGRGGAGPSRQGTADQRHLDGSGPHPGGDPGTVGD